MNSNKAFSHLHALKQSSNDVRGPQLLSYYKTKPPALWISHEVWPALSTMSSH